MDNLWIDTQGDGYPDLNNDKFVPVFIKENKKSLDNLAKMMLVYDFNCDIYYEDDVYVMIRENNIGQEEENRLNNEILCNVELTSFISALFELGYIEVLVYNDTDGKSVYLRFSDFDGPFGPIARSARYIPKDVLKDHPRKWEYLGQYHVKGNWFYMTEGRI